MKTLALAIMLFISIGCLSQSFPAIGQLASTAFQICDADTFKQFTVPVGSTHIMRLPHCSADSLDYPDTNPFWYSFTCFSAGSLGFLISPNNLQDDYDWMLYDITGHVPDDVYTDPGLIVTGNWAGTPGLTGAAKGGSSEIKCASFPADSVTTFSRMPELIAGHHYLLFISHYNQTQNGYSLDIGGGTAVISDTRSPELQSASMFCNGKTLTVVLNKKMRCSSLAANGSDFAINSHPGVIISAASSKCSSADDMDSVVISLNEALPAGNYTLTSQTGTDGNTLLDACGNVLNVGQRTGFTVTPSKVPTLDSMAYSACSPNTAELKFSDSIMCNSIDADGSDFIIRGNQSARITAASGYCTNGFTKTVRITFDSPIITAGNYQLLIKTGNDGNTLLSACGTGAEENTFIAFSIKDILSANFSSKINPGCLSDTIEVSYPYKNQVNQWQWSIAGTEYGSSEQELSFIETGTGSMKLRHIVSNGYCSDTATQLIAWEDHPLKASFSFQGGDCPQEVISFNNTSSGDLVSWFWNFDDGTTSDEKNPPSHLFPNMHGGKTFNVNLIVGNSIGCYDTANVKISKLQSCAEGVPNAFTPNGDGLNDYLYPLNIQKFSHVEFKVFNRSGQIMFESRDSSRKWDGRLNGEMQPAGTYVWILSYVDASGEKMNKAGTTILIR